MSPVSNVSPNDDYLGERHVYQPHRAGLPQLRPYFRELWRRRGFAVELARSQMRAAHTDTVFGQAWLIINPLLLAGVYFVLVDVLSRGAVRSPTFFAQLTSGLFLYYYITGCMTSGATSVTGGGRLIMNTSFPKMLLTLSTTYLAFRRYLPTLLVYIVVHILVHAPVTWNLLWYFPILLMATLFGLGLANVIATLQVYFRDTASFLPYVVRIWLYLSPVLWTVALAGAKSGKLVEWGPINPLFNIIGAQGEVLVQGHAPDPKLMLFGTLWAVGTLLIGSWLFMSREREFAVRL